MREGSQIHNADVVQEMTLLSMRWKGLAATRKRPSITVGEVA